MQKSLKKEKAEKVNTVVAWAAGGLMNRVKCLVSSIRLAEYHDCELLVYWKPDQDCFCECFDIFENKFNFLLEEPEASFCELPETLLYRSWRFWVFEGELPDGFTKIYPFSPEMGDRVKYYLSHSRSKESIDAEYHRIPETLRKTYLLYLNQLIVKSEILGKVFEQDKLIGPEAVGLHVRRTDFSDYTDGRTCATDEAFFSCMDKMPNAHFFLSTDCEATEQEFISRYSGQIFSYKNKSRVRDSKSGIIDGLIDALLLSRRKTIFGSHMSTFSELAWWFGGCKSEFVAIGAEERYKEN